MNKIAKFEKVSFQQFKEDWIKTFESKFSELEEETIDSIIHNIYDSIKLPKRATSGSAGHDFFSPSNFVIAVNGSIKIPTGIRCKIDDGWVLQAFPRSGHGFKYGIRIANTVGIIDADYFYADNEGHIFIKLVNDSALAKSLTIGVGEAFCQGMFTPYGVTVDDDVTAVRHGGFGSTSK